MKIVLTGASGFIAGSFLRYLAEQGQGDHRIICLSNSDAGQEKLMRQWPRMEVLPLRSLTEKVTQDAVAEADAIIHCGWSTVPRTADADPEKDLLENVHQGIGLIRRAIGLGIGRMVFLSSGGTVYGDGDRPHREDDPTRPTTAYGISKLAFEHYLVAMSSGTPMRPLILRPGNVYGRTSDPLRPQGVVEHWMHQIVHDRPVHVWGDLSVTRDYVHIRDLLRVMEVSLTYNGDRRVFNVGTGVGTSLRQVLGLLAEVSGRGPDIVHSSPGAVKGPRVNVLDGALLRQEMDITPGVDLRQGLTLLWSALEREIE